MRSPATQSVALAIWTTLVWLSAVEAADKPSTATASDDSWITAVAWSPDGARVVAARDDSTLAIYCAADQRQVALIDELKSPVTAVAWLPDGRIVTGHWDGALEVRSLAGVLLSRRPAHRESVLALATSSDGRRLASGGADDRLQVWDLANGQNVFDVPAENDYDLTAVAFSPDGRFLVAGDGDNHLGVWDARSGDRLLELPGHTEAISACSFSPDGRHIASASWDDTLRVWDADTGRELRHMANRGCDVSCATFLPDGRRIVAGSDDGVVRLWNSETGQRLESWDTFGARVLCLAVSKDGRDLAVGSRGPLRILRLPDERRE